VIAGKSRPNAADARFFMRRLLKGGRSAFFPFVANRAVDHMPDFVAKLG
jgi:hypothetical protein